MCRAWLNGGASTSCTARTATAGKYATSGSASWPPARPPPTRPCCSGGSSPHVTVLTHTPLELTPEQQEQFGAVGIGVIEGPVTGIEADDGGLAGVRLANGTGGGA